MIKEKKISILISTYNKCKFIKKTIKSCLNQKYSNYEIIIVDTQSTDGTDRIISSFSHFKKIKFLKIKRKFKNSPLNQLEAIKYGLLRTKGEIVCLLDGDDLFKKTKLQEVNKFFQSQNSTNFLQDRIELKKKSSKKKGHFYSLIFYQIFFPQVHFQLKKKV